MKNININSDVACYRYRVMKTYFRDKVFIKQINILTIRAEIKIEECRSYMKFAHQQVMREG